MLGQIIEKLGGWGKMTAEERQTYLAWEKVLAQADVTIDDLKNIIPVEIARAEAELEEYRNEPKQDIYLKAYVRSLRFLQNVITTPKQKREDLQAYLKKRFAL